MQAIAAFVLRGRNQAVLSIIGFALLALFFTPMGLFSAAAIGLVTLVHGEKQGLIVVLLASVFMLVVSSLTGQMILGVEFVVFYWLPVWFLARLLGSNVSLSLVVVVAVFIGILAAIGIAALYVNYEAQWNKMILDNLLPAFEEAKMNLPQQDLKAFLLKVGKWVVNYGAAYWVLTMSVSLFIARWWQSQLYHPGGFGDEYRQLRFGVMFSVMGMLLIALATLVHGGLLGEIFFGIACIVVTMFLLQGLAVAHYYVKARKLRSVWLFMLYALMLVLMPYELFLIVFIGLSDNWVHYRKRIEQV